MAANKKVLFIAFLTVFLDLIGFGVIIPIQPFYAEMIGASPTLVTMLGASYSFMQFLFAPFWGRLSDRVGRRPIILIGISTSIVGYTIFGFAESLLVLFASRLLTGFGNANIGAAQAIIADVTDEESRAKGMGIIGAAFGLGFIFGPALGGALGQVSPTAPAFGAAALGVVNLILAYFLLPETNVDKGQAHSAHKPGLSISGLKNASKRLNVLPILVITLLTILAFALMEQIVGLYIESAWLQDTALNKPSILKESAKITSIFLVAVGITATIVQGGLIGRLSKRYGERRLCQAGVIILCVSMFLTPVMVDSKSWILLLLNGAMLALGMGLFNPSTTAFISKCVPKRDQGGTLGLNQSMASLGRVIGPVLSGPLFEIGKKLPFYVGGLIFVAAAFIALQLKPAQDPVE
ncbi:MFS transporter [Pseudobacteriovorax antillogorgiicola]|uniref:Multidrug resistance protein n=1 Tax=Pseudobacteriovorax antillogorgiicola TaxID=1513793 RepID=A0A1Y6CGX8_9BACT|nr:MFS transporter [Pseudobacteriovorax antillogorgiicola]TCS47230.1 multidrug resistance protein [Pseudobacteriovorax antillogorgiicola]SMF61927.1 Multidrug resistance protein [Pseudobacteriovorax antillogorgiicola]